MLLPPSKRIASNMGNKQQTQAQQEEKHTLTGNWAVMI
jgi:hypothetical protein